METLNTDKTDREARRLSEGKSQEQRESIGMVRGEGQECSAQEPGQRSSAPAWINFIGGLESKHGPGSIHSQAVS